MSNAFFGMFGVFIAAIPVFMGFLYTGYAMFHEQEYLSTLEKWTVSLVSMISGDEMINTMDNTGKVFGF
jgi:hypothetical protein